MGNLLVLSKVLDVLIRMFHYIDSVKIRYPKNEDLDMSYAKYHILSIELWLFDRLLRWELLLVLLALKNCSTPYDSIHFKLQLS